MPSPKQPQKASTENISSENLLPSIRNTGPVTFGSILRQEGLDWLNKWFVISEPLTGVFEPEKHDNKDSGYSLAAINSALWKISGQFSGK